MNYITAERLPDTSNTSKIGVIRWFTGTKEDVLSGSMKLSGEINSIICDSIGNGNAWNSTSISDSGNIGCCIAPDGLYVVFGSILKQFFVNNGYTCSNQGLKMFRLGIDNVGNNTDPYYDESQKERLDALYKEMSANHDYYIYDMKNTNFYDTQFKGVENSYALPSDPKMIIEIGDKDFEVNMIYVFQNLGIGNNLWSQYAPYMPLGFQTSDGKLHAIVAHGVNQFGFNAGDPKDGENPFALACGRGIAYITFKRENGHLYFTVNGATITDPVYDNYDYKDFYKIADVTKDSLIWNYEPNSEPNSYKNYFENLTDWMIKNTLGGYKLLTIDIKS